MNAMRRALASGSATFGGWMFLPTPLSAQLFAQVGYEWIVLDAQHGSVTAQSVPAAIQGAKLGGAAVAVRVEWNSPAAIMRALDFQADAVIVPMVNTAAEARVAADATRYPPRGTRSLGRLLGASTATDDANDDVLCIVMVETVEAVLNVHEIAQTPGVDGLFFGPADYRLSSAATADAPDLDAALDLVVAATREAALFVATIVPDAEAAATMLTRGVRMIAIGSDVGYLRGGARADLVAIKDLHAGVTATG